MNAKFRLIATWLAVVVALASCNSLVHDDLSGCPNGLVIELTPLYADRITFESELTDVHIFVYDQNDNCVSELYVDGSTLQVYNFKVKIDVPAGTYHIVVWNGLLDTVNYTSTRSADVNINFDDTDTNGNCLTPLWHGASPDVEVEATEETVVTVPMVKDTNTVTVLVGTTTNEPMTADRFTYDIIAHNGAIASDNSLTDNSQVMYRNFESAVTTTEGSLADYPEDSLGQLSVALGVLNTSRLTVDRTSYLRITDNATGKYLLTINLTQYILLARSSAVLAGADGDQNQVYLDTEDKFNFVFILAPADSSDNTGEDADAYIIHKVTVNGWTVRLNNTGIK
jgi:hypothetical protein